MNIFVIATSAHGKTPFIEKVSKAIGYGIVPTSQYVREPFNKEFDTSKFSRNEYTQNITKYAIAKLKDNPNACIDYINEHYNDLNQVIFDSIRTPYDFVKLFNPKDDSVVFLNCLERTDSVDKTNLEEGIDIIESYVKYMINVGIMDKKNHFDIKIEKHIIHENHIDMEDMYCCLDSAAFCFVGEFLKR